jgi:hypothetical protein
VLKAINAIRTSLMIALSAHWRPKEEKKENEFDAPLKIDVTDAEDDDAPLFTNSLFSKEPERASDVHIEPYETSSCSISC